MLDFLIALKKEAPRNIEFGVGSFTQSYIVVYEVKPVSLFGHILFTYNSTLVEITSHFRDPKLYLIGFLWRYRYKESHKEFWIHLRKVAQQHGVILHPSAGSFGREIPYQS